MHNNVKVDLLIIKKKKKKKNVVDLLKSLTNFKSNIKYY